MRTSSKKSLSAFLMSLLATFALALTLSVVVPVTSPTTAQAHSIKGIDPLFTTSGLHYKNGRKWMTACGAYSTQITSCRTDIWATQVKYVNGRYVHTTDWYFNNLTYYGGGRSVWKGNQLGYPNTWTSWDGRSWRTTCTGGRFGSCKSYIRSLVIESTSLGNGNYSYNWIWREIYNNQVSFKLG